MTIYRKTDEKKLGRIQEKIFFTLIFTQYKVQESLDVEGYRIKDKRHSL